MRSIRRVVRPMAEINVVPYIDVMLVLLVIFMVTTPLLTQGVKIELPQAKANAINTEGPLPLVVTVDANGKYYVNRDNADMPLTIDELAVKVAALFQFSKQKNEELVVLIKGDRDVDYGRVVAAMVLLQQSGIDKVGLMTEDPMV